MRVLVVDDDEDALRIACDCLRLAGHVPIGLPDQWGVVAHAATVDAAVIDLMLPMGLGTSAVDALREAAGWLVPVIFLTGASPGTLVVQKAKTYLAAVVLLKGRPSQLVPTLEHLCRAYAR